MHAPPPHGISLPVRWHRVIDGDKVEVRLPTGPIVQVWLIDCWAAELAVVPDGPAAKHAVEGLLEATADQVLTLCVPWNARDTDANGTVDLDEVIRGLLSFARVLGHLFAGTVHVGEWMIEHGHAHRTRDEQRDAARGPAPRPRQ